MFCVNDSKEEIKKRIISSERKFLVAFQMMFSACLGLKIIYIRKITKFLRRSFCDDLKIKLNLPSKRRLVRSFFYLVDLQHVLC